MDGLNGLASGLIYTEEMRMRLKIKDWDRHFETAKSKTYKRSNRVYLPNKIGMGLAYILSLPDGAAIFGNFVLIAECCSVQAAPRAGNLTDDGKLSGRPWNYEDIAIRIRRPVEEVARCVEICSCERVGWMIDTDTKYPRGIRGKDTTVVAEYPSLSIRLDKSRVEKNTCPTDGQSADADVPLSRSEKNIPPGFVQFWSLYPAPGRNSRKKCLAIWRRDKLESKADEINGGLARWLQSQRWAEGVILNATTWLNDQRWENAPPPAPRAAEPDLPPVIYPSVEEALAPGAK